MLCYTPTDWYWLADDGRLFSSARATLVPDDDPAYAGFVSTGGVATRWPEDDDGYQTDAALAWVLNPHGITVATTLASLRAAKIEELRAACAAAILGGVTVDALGAPHLYPTDATAQTNVGGLVMRSLLPTTAKDWTCLFACADAGGVWAYRLHTVAQIRAVGETVAAHVEAAMVTFDGLRAAVGEAKTPEAVAAVTWPG